ncbi:HTH-type transcriptional activator Btr [compost metagenome]
MVAENSSVELYSHTFWKRKAQFVLDQDIYDHWTMFAVEEGRFHYRIEGHAGEAGHGDVVICPPLTWFGREVIEPLSFHFFHFSLEGEVDHVNRNEALFRSYKHVVEDTQRLSSTYRLFHLLEKGGAERYAAGMQHLLNDLLFQLGTESQMREYNRVDVRVEDTVMQGAMTWMREHAYSPLSLRELAFDLHMTPVQLTRRFRSAFGLTPSDYVTNLRLQRAGLLLEETSLTLERIAQQCGYENGFYLSRVFHKKKGMSPSHYRKMKRV